MDTTASFSTVGSYVLRLTANDGAVSNFDDVAISVSVVGAGSAVDFGGSNAYMSIASPTAMGASTFTLEAWINRQGAGVGTETGANGFTDAIPIVTKGTSEDDPAGGSNIDMNYFLGIDNATGRLAADFEEASNGSSPSLNHPASGTSVIPMNTWTHIAATYDGTWRLYVNGVLETTLAVNQPPRSDSIQPFAIASALTSTNVPEGFFNGVIDEVRVWNVARTATEILNSMSLEIPTAPNLIGRWSFNDGSGASVADSTGNANGALNGTYAWVPGAPFGGGNNAAPDQPALVAPANGATGGRYAADPFRDGVGPRQRSADREFPRPPRLRHGAGLPDRRAPGHAALCRLRELPRYSRRRREWIVNNRDPLNIVFATQLGDITEHSTASSWNGSAPIRAWTCWITPAFRTAWCPETTTSIRRAWATSSTSTAPSRYFGTPWYAGPWVGSTGSHQPPEQEQLQLVLGGWTRLHPH